MKILIGKVHLKHHLHMKHHHHHHHHKHETNLEHLKGMLHEMSIVPHHKASGIKHRRVKKIVL